MRFISLAVGLLCFCFSAFSQSGNEWLNPSAPYFKIPVGKEGLYRLSQSQLTAAGVPAGVNPASLQLYYRGIEQSIYIEGQSDGQLNAGDFLEFYGRPNDGHLDTELYTPSAAQPHLKVSLFTDTAFYFLTYGQATGKRISVSNESASGLSAEPFHWDEKLLILKDQYSGGRDYNEVQLSVFEYGEGWTGAQILTGQTGSYQIEGILRPVPTAATPHIELGLTGRGPMVHVGEIYAGSRLIGTVNFNGFETLVFQQSLQWSDVSGDGKVTINVKVLGSNGLSDRFSVGYIKVRYPQQTDMASQSLKKIISKENPAGTSLLALTNTVAGSRIFDITNPNTVSRLSTTGTTTLHSVIPESHSERTLFVSSQVETTTIRRTSFRHFTPGSVDYLIITHPSLRKPVAGYIDPVKAYAEYRSLPEGGGYDTLVVNITQLYDQFAYGDPSPLAIYHFIKYISTGNIPDYLFIVGKGLDPYFNYHRTPASFPQYKNLIPSAGYPASDMLYSAGIAGPAHVAAISTGRLSAIGPEDVAAYFNKVKEFESSPFTDLRKKNLLHLSGGLYPGEPELFRSILSTYGDIAKQEYLGANVKSIAKQSTDIEVVNVAEEVNNGVALITMFGHSAPTASDFDIGLVTDPVMGYNNKGKYPALLLNGCSAGSFFLNASIFGENWVLTPDRGAIGIIAHSYFGFANTLSQYSNFFYDIAFADPNFINRGLGDVQREVASRYLNREDVYPIDITQVQQMVLLGDPAIRLFAATQPDYGIVPESVSLQAKNGDRLDAFADSLQLRFIVHNYGKAVSQPFLVRVTRTLNDGSVVQYDSAFTRILYSDTILFDIPGHVENGFGNNSFSISIDALAEVPELSESNNDFSKSFFIPLSGTRNLYPDKFSIVTTLNVNLTFQHSDQLSDERIFLLELDTTASFNSGFKQWFELSEKVLAMQPVSLLEKDSLVYYWRTKLAQPLANENPEWEVSSFTFIENGNEGWSQSQFSQLIENRFDGLSPQQENGRFEFIGTETNLSITTYTADQPHVSSVKIDNTEYNIIETNNFVCRDNTINLIAFDKTTTQPYLGIFFTWIEIRDQFQGRRLYCGREPYVINSFAIDELTMGNNADLIQYIDNIEEGDSVILFNNGDAGFVLWPDAAKNKLAELGLSLDQFNQINSGDAVIIRGRKGAPAGSALLFVNSQSTSTTHEGTVTGRRTSGSIETDLIGPSSQWHELIVKPVGVEMSDNVTFDLIGVSLEGQSQLISSNITGNTPLTNIDAVEYPFIKLRFHASDETFVTAAQINKWMVLYEPVAEGLLLFTGAAQQSSLAEGDTLQLGYQFVNVSNQSFTDSLTVNARLFNPETLKNSVNAFKIQAPAPGATTTFVADFLTIQQSGFNDVELFVNPKISPEGTYENNVINLSSRLRVLADSVPPVLAVTFDGRVIARNEVVAPSPVIAAKIWDNNPFRYITDTTTVKIFLKLPCGTTACDFERVYFKPNQITWSPETTESEFQFQFTPTFAVEGQYILRIEAADISGNLASTEPYEISFNISLENSIAFIDPYPNPFSTETNFEFVVSGNSIPTDGVLRLFNTSGRLVNNYPVDVSSLVIGKNSIRWPGLDVSGNAVPNGIYIYKFIFSHDGVTVTDIGKVVLMR